ncbi:MAG TPA: hypothetical protein VG479_02175 [Gaiellaceae bacterium]|jgi:hypothetical protein|nr:hypothetical protein [Gaiellaceae bacterium]
MTTIENEHEVRTETETETHAWGGPPVVRGLVTLLGVAGAGFLVWLATTFDLASTREYWAAMAILAGAGIVLGLSQLIGGWTKWGTPTISPGVLLIGFLPTFVAVGGILVATRPTGTSEGDQVAGWIGDIGLDGVAGDLIVFQGVLAFGLGIVFTFVFDTRGPRIRSAERELEVSDEEVHDYRAEEPADETAVQRDRAVTITTASSEAPTVVERREDD